MNRVLIWSDLADEDIDEILEHLSKKWGATSVANFLNRIEESLKAVLSDPETYMVVDANRKIHKFQLNKHVTLYYRVTDTTIDLITFWRNKKDDFTLRQLLK